MVAALRDLLLLAVASSLSGPLSAQRTVTWARSTVSDVRAVRHGLGGTVNDVVLTAVTGGFRPLLLSRGETPRPTSVRTLVPVNVPAPGEENIRDNRISLMLAELAVDVADPVSQLDVVRARLDQLKHSGEAGAVVTGLVRAETDDHLLGVLPSHRPQRPRSAPDMPTAEQPAAVGQSRRLPAKFGHR